MSLADTTNLVGPIHHYGDQFRSIVPSSAKGELILREQLPQAWKEKLQQGKPCADRGESISDFIT